MRRLGKWTAGVLAIVIVLVLAASASAAIVGWGENAHGNLGEGTTGPPTADAVGTLITSASELTTGNSNGYALEPDGTVMAWGGRNYGQDCDGIKAGTKRPAARPILSHLAGIASIAAGGAHVAATGTDGTLWTCGSSGYGQLCNGFTAKGLKTGIEYGEANPVHVAGLGSVARAFVGGPDVGILLTDGTLLGCGQNKAGELGPPSGEHTRPTPIPHGCSVREVALGGNATKGDHAIILCADGTVEALGHGRYGELGTGILGNSNAPAKVPGLTGVSMVAAGDDSSMALSEGKVYSWGENEVGELGVGAGPEVCDGGSGPRPCSRTPVQVPNLSGIEGIEAGNGFEFAWSKGLAFSWGFNLQGELGLGAFSSPLGTPREVQTRGILEIDAQEHGALAATTGQAPPPLLTQQPVSGGLALRWRDSSSEAIKWLIGWAPVTRPATRATFERLDPSARSVTITGLRPGQEYEVRVHDTLYGTRIIRGVPLA